MITVPGYSNLHIVHQSDRTLVFSARAKDGSQVILRQLRPEIASPDLVARYRNEYGLLKQLDCPQVARAHDLLDVDGTPVLVLEHCDGIALSECLAENQLGLREAIKIAESIAQGLAYIHSRSIIHKDINPSNIIYNRHSGEIKIVDFGIASSLAYSTLKSEAPGTIEGTLGYLSPEQTGRMNRSVDYRSDFYSLGATLYHLLTGDPPFPSSDTLEMVYNHIAREPVPPHEKSAEIPTALSRIVVKLLAKIPEDRYQSAHAICGDLTKCLELMQGDSRDSAEFDF